MLVVHMTVGVGADIEALCAKCGDVWHVVVAKDNKGRIAKVQCKQCQGYHRYKPVAGASKEAKLPAAIRPPKEAKEIRDAKAAAAPSARFDKPAVEADLAKPPKSYRASERYGEFRPGCRRAFGARQDHGVLRDRPPRARAEQGRRYRGRRIVAPQTVRLLA
jgi:hypothetical protein